MTCDCIDLINTSLAERNSKLDVGFTFGHEGRPGYSFPALSTSKINTRNRDRAGAIPTFCPFCGIKYRASGTDRATQDVLAERRRQISVEGWTPEHDDAHDKGELAASAACYATSVSVASRFVANGTIPASEIDAAVGRCEAPPGWPWGPTWWKPKGRRRDLVRAAALIIAEIERLDRAAEPEGR